MSGEAPVRKAQGAIQGPVGRAEPGSPAGLFLLGGDKGTGTLSTSIRAGWTSVKLMTENKDDEYVKSKKDAK
jgi:hypothetical protein